MMVPIKKDATSACMLSNSDSIFVRGSYRKPILYAEHRTASRWRGVSAGRDREITD